MSYKHNIFKFLGFCASFLGNITVWVGQKMLAGTKIVHTLFFRVYNNKEWQTEFLKRIKQRKLHIFYYFDVLNNKLSKSEESHQKNVVAYVHIYVNKNKFKSYN